MAKIPTYDNLTVQERALEAPRQTGAIEGAFIDQGSAAVAKGMQDVANTAAIIGGNEQRLELEARAKERDNKLADAYRDLLHNPESGFLNQAGKNAIDGRKATVEALGKVEQQFLNEEMSPMERRNFVSLAARRKESALLQIDTHTSSQTRAFSITQTAARAEAQVQDMSSNWGGYNDPSSTYSTAKATGLREIDNLAALNGWDKDITDGKKREFLSGAHKTVIDNMLASEKTTDAKAYFDKFGGEIDERTKDGIKKELRHSSVKSDSLNLSYDLAKVGGLSAQTKAADDMFKAGKIDAETRDATVQRLEHNYTRNKSMQEEGNKAMRGQLQEWVINNPGKLITDAPTKLYGWAKGNGELATFDSFAQREGRPAARQQELKMRGELLNMAMTDPDSFIAEFKRTQFGDRMDLGINGIKEMQNVASEMLRGDGKYKTTFNQKTLQDAIPADLLKPANKDKRDAFVALMSEESDRWKKANPGKTPDDAAYKQVVQAANGEWIKTSAIWNSNYKTYELRVSPDPDAMPKRLYDEIKKKNEFLRDADVGEMWHGNRVPNDVVKEGERRGRSKTQIFQDWENYKKSEFGWKKKESK